MNPFAFFVYVRRFLLLLLLCRVNPIFSVLSKAYIIVYDTHTQPPHMCRSAHKVDLAPACLLLFCACTHSENFTYKNYIIPEFHHIWILIRKEKEKQRQKVIKPGAEHYNIHPPPLNFFLLLLHKVLHISFIFL